MKILFVEDHETFIRQIQPLLEEVAGVDSVTQVRTRDDALGAIAADVFDLVILDLTIPPAAGSLEIAPEHGQTVFHEIRGRAPGTPVFILTGSEPDEFSRRLARYGENIDIWGAGAGTNTVDYFLKEEVDQLIERVGEFAGIIANTNAVTIDTRGRDLGLSSQHSRIVRVFARKAGGVSCEVKSLGGGLSDARVIRAVAKDSQGKHLAVCAGKLGSKSDVDAESDAYEKHVKRLKIGAFPPVFCTIDKGVGGAAGLFYTLAEDDNETLFDLIARDQKTASKVVEAVRAGLGRWIDARTVAEVPIADIRRSKLSDDALSKLQSEHDLAFTAAVEAKVIRSSQACIHGDLHGGNILVNGKGVPVLIDFGDVGPGFSCIDPVTLELGLIFHPEAVRLGFSTSLSELVESWPDIDQYIKNNPVGAVVESCREWAHDVGAGDTDVLAAGYAFAIRQLKYPTVDSAVTLRLVSGISEKIVAN